IIDNQILSNPDPHLLKKKTELQSKFDLLSTTQAEKRLLQSKGYLGIHITRKFSHLHDINLETLLQKTKLYFQKWKCLPLTLMGRVNVVKMTILPKFLFVFQCIPLFIPKSFFRSLNQLISSFLWDGKPPRISIRTLQKPHSQGGLALPNFLFYYWAANIQKLIFWLQTPRADWCLLEASSCNQSSLPALIHSSLPIALARKSTNPIVYSTLRIWSQFCSHIKDFNQGITKFKDLFDENTKIFLNFPDLQIPNSEI
uniref:Reverse transcriptase domain-containing protein n=1 Tax=Pygocentrus nattereri TaxID=42514 RepID=A0AAR2JPM8_PYGNA